MKRILLIIAIFPLFLSLLFGCPVTFAAETENREWSTCTEEEVSFHVPPKWSVTRNPQEGILIQLKPEPSLGERLFFYLGRNHAPSIIKLSPKDEKDSFHQLAIMMRRIIERQGVTAVLKEDQLTKISGHRTLDIHYEVNASTGISGFARVVLMMTPNVYYGFMCMSLGDNLNQDRMVFEKIVKSIKIDLSKIPADIGPKNYSEVIQKVKLTLDTAFQGMPIDWDWKLKSLEMGKGEKATDLFLHLSLNRRDAVSLADGYALVLSCLKKGRNLRSDQIKCNHNNLSVFCKQFGMILGMATSNCIGIKELPVKHICIDIHDRQGKTSKTFSTDIVTFSEAIQSNNTLKAMQAIECK